MLKNDNAKEKNKRGLECNDGGFCFWSLFC